MNNSQFRPVIISFFVAIIIVSGIFCVRYYGDQNEEVDIIQRSFDSVSSQIFISGAVSCPGLYPLKPDDSIDKLVRAAGGITATETEYMKLYIPEGEENSNGQKIDINRAEVWLLQALPGIGATRAEAIVSYRNRYGPFRSTEELIYVEGIGMGIFQNIEPLITVAE